MKKWNSLVALLVFVAICFAVAGFGALFTASSVNDWYRTLQRPSWNPPSWVFGPVWTALYTTMAIAAWLVWRRRDAHKARGALTLFAVQLVLNAAWSPLFFGLQNPLAGLLVIVPLWCAIVATLVAFWKISSLAGILFVPYLLWVSFATVLNFTIWRMNA